ncbi:hypothetical protein VB002_05225 [Campylobacter concisus]
MLVRDASKNLSPSPNPSSSFKNSPSSIIAPRLFWIFLLAPLEPEVWRKNVEF